MASLDTSLNFEGLLLRTAEALSLADNTGSVVGIPTNSTDLDIVKRALWDGLEMFYRGLDPRTGKVRLWSFLTPTVELTIGTAATNPRLINGDTSRYLLDLRVQGAPVGRWSWSDGSGWFGRALSTSIDRVDMAHGGAAVTGPPQMAAVAPLEGRSAAGQRQGWEVRVYPKPDRAYTLRARFRLWPPRMEHVSEKHLAGAQHDQTIIAQAVWARRRFDAKDPAERAGYKAAADEAMIASIELDLQNEPDNAGPLTDLSDPSGKADPFENSAGSPIIVNGVTVL